MSRKLLKLLLPVATGALLLGIWSALQAWVLSEERRFLLPAPGDVWAAFLRDAPVLLHAAGNTAEGALLGFGLSVVVSCACALLLSLSPWIRASLYPFLTALQLTPLPILAPICVIWVGAGLASVSVLTFVIAFFPLVVNTTQGLISVDRHLLDLFSLYRASRLQQLLLLRVPAALPYFFTGLRIAATLAPIGAVVADMSAGSSAGDGGGLGFQAVIYSSQLRIPALFATAALTCLLGFVFNAAILALSWLALHHWHDSYERSDR